jgi:hypothetical protein
MGKTMEDVAIDNYFLKTIPIAQEITARINKWN